MQSLIGTGVALVTPFKKDFSVDTDALRRIVNFQVDNGIEYLVVLLVRFKATVGTAFVAFGSHNRVAAKTFNVFQDPGIVGGYENFLQVGFGGLLVNPLDHGFTANIGERFSRKAGGSKSSRNYSQNTHGLL